MKLRNEKPLNDLVDQEPECAVPLAVWRDTVFEAEWDSFGEMARELVVAPVEGSGRVLFTLPKICLVEAKVHYAKRIVLVTSARLVQVFGRRAA